MRLAEASLGQLLADEAWVRWAKGLDSALLGGPEATLVAAAVVGEQVVGVCAGDSPAYLVPFDGTLRRLTGSASKARLGSGGDGAVGVSRDARRPRRPADGLRRGLDAAGVGRHRAGGTVHVDAAVRGPAVGGSRRRLAARAR